MKRTALFFVSILIIVGLLSGCGLLSSLHAPQKTPPATQNPQSSSQTDTTRFIGVEKAKEIALANAGIPPEGVLFDRVELEKNDGVWQYEVEFHKERTEYDADIKADDGTILSWDTDYN